MPRILSYLVSLNGDNLPYIIITRTDQGQGGGIAIEDSATLTVVLPLGTKPEEIPERLALYEKIRYERANNIQEYSRQAGRDCVDGKPTIDSLSHGFQCFIWLLIMHSDEIHGLQFWP